MSRLLYLHGTVARYWRMPSVAPWRKPFSHLRCLSATMVLLIGARRPYGHWVIAVCTGFLVQGEGGRQYHETGASVKAVVNGLLFWTMTMNGSQTSWSDNWGWRKGWVAERCAVMPSVLFQAVEIRGITLPVVISALPLMIWLTLIVLSVAPPSSIVHLWKRWRGFLKGRK